MANRPAKYKPRKNADLRYPLRDIIHDTAVSSAQKKAVVALVLNHFFDSLARALARGKIVDINNFGMFQIRGTSYPNIKSVKFTTRHRLRDYISKPYAHLKREAKDPTDGT